jgi:hypothetical protein
MELANLGEAAITSERELEIAMASCMPILVRRKTDPSQYNE